MKVRPRVSLRTLVILVTLVCAYFGAWEATKRYGCRDAIEHLTGGLLSMTASSPGPFIVCVEEPVTLWDRSTSVDPSTIRVYYLWIPSRVFDNGIAI